MTSERVSRDDSWPWVILTIVCVAFGFWSWRQIRDLAEDRDVLRNEVRQLQTRVASHQVELARLKVVLPEPATDTDETDTVARLTSAEENVVDPVPEP